MIFRESVIDISYNVNTYCTVCYTLYMLLGLEKLNTMNSCEIGLLYNNTVFYNMRI